MLTHDEKRLQSVLRLWGLVFSIVGIGFAFASDWIIGLINLVSIKLAPQSPLLPVTGEHFWLALTVSMMATISALCFYAQQDPRRKKEMVVCLLVSKLTSTVFFLLYYFIYLPSFGFLVGALTDGSIFIVTFLLYKRATRSSQLLM